MSEPHLIRQRRKICLEPYELSNIQESISKHLDTLVSTSIEEGYILTVSGIHDCSTNIIDATTGFCIFHVDYELEVIKPTLGHIYTCMVNIIFKEGIFVQLYEMNILIPSQELENKGWVFDKHRYTKNRSTIESGSWISVELTSIRFEDNIYRCVGTLAPV